MSRAAIASLPAELLAKVMQDADDPLTMSAVCAHWRRLGLHTPRLWTRLFIDDSRIGASVFRTSLFAVRSGALPLSIERAGSFSVFDYRLIPSVERLNHLVLALFARCEAFAYQRIMYRERKRQTATFIRSLFFTRAPLLHTLDLSDLWNSEYEHDAFATGAPTPNIVLTFPALKKIILGACLPFDQLSFCDIQDLRINLNCIDDCRSFDSLGRDIGSIVHASPATRRMDLYASPGLTIATEVDYESYVDVEAVLARTLHYASIVGIPLNWTTRAASNGEPLDLPLLTSLVLSGEVTRPGVRGTLWGDVSQDPAHITSFLRILSGAPNLSRLSIDEWTDEIDVEIPYTRASVHMAHLADLRLASVHPTWCKHILAALVMPSLVRLGVDAYYWSDEEARLSAFFVPTSTYPWVFPTVQRLDIETSAHDIGCIRVPAEELARLLRDGDWRTLTSLTIAGHKWVFDNTVDAVIEALRDGSVVSSLTGLAICRCSPLLGAHYGPGLGNADVLDRDAENIARGLNNARSGRRSSSAQVDSELTVTFTRCDSCAWPDAI